MTALLRALMAAILLFPAGCCRHASRQMKEDMDSLTLDYDTPLDAGLQAELLALDARLRGDIGMAEDETAAGVYDLRAGRLAMINPDKIDYAASVTKIAILLAWFQIHREAATDLDGVTQHELGLMIKVSDNGLASKYSHLLGLKEIQRVLDSYHFYDPARGGGLWMGKHYSRDAERYGDPLADHSHAATVRQLLRFYLLLEQGRLVSQEASLAMREIFDSPEIAHLNDKFVKGLAGREVQILRKAGWWEDWLHDTAVVSGPGRYYIIVAMTQHAKGDDYLEAFARGVDDLMVRAAGETP